MNDMFNKITRVMPKIIWHGPGMPSDIAPKFPLDRWERIGIDTLLNEKVFSIRSVEINHWIQEQPVHMWKHYTLDNYSPMLIGAMYLFTEEMEAWFLLRWS